MHGGEGLGKESTRKFFVIVEILFDHIVLNKGRKISVYQKKNY